MNSSFSFPSIGAEDSFNRYLGDRANKELHCLQIGAYEGDATSYLLEHILTNSSSTLTDVDTWSGSGLPEESGINWSDVEDTYDNRHRDAITSGRLIKHKMTSNQFFESNTKKFDFIYVDGNRIGPAVLQDGMNAVRCLEPDGLLAFNDTAWRRKNTASLGPSPAISALSQVYSEEVSVLEAANVVWMRRN